MLLLLLLLLLLLVIVNQQSDFLVIGYFFTPYFNLLFIVFGCICSVLYFVIISLLLISLHWFFGYPLTLSNNYSFFFNNKSSGSFIFVINIIQGSTNFLFLFKITKHNPIFFYLHYCYYYFKNQEEEGLVFDFKYNFQLLVLFFIFIFILYSSY